MTPRRIASIALSAVGAAVITTHGTSRSYARTTSSTSTPDAPARFRSVKTASNDVRVTFASASFAVVAVSTTYPSRTRSRESAAASLSSSSTSRIAPERGLTSESRMVSCTEGLQVGSEGFARHGPRTNVRKLVDPTGSGVTPCQPPP
jgi:hypothetical protein